MPAFAGMTKLGRRGTSGLHWLWETQTKDAIFMLVGWDAGVPAIALERS
jgi:hypothetical protein